MEFVFHTNKKSYTPILLLIYHIYNYTKSLHINMVILFNCITGQYVTDIVSCEDIG